MMRNPLHNSFTQVPGDRDGKSWRNDGSIFHPFQHRSFPTGNVDLAPLWHPTGHEYAVRDSLISASLTLISIL